MDGKHVAIHAPADTESQYHNYKHFHSFVLLTLVDASYRFISVMSAPIAKPVMPPPGYNYGKSKIASAMRNNTVNLPSARHLLGRANEVPFVIIGYQAFISSDTILDEVVYIERAH